MLNTRLPRRAVLALTAPAALSACGLTAARFTADPPPEGVEAAPPGYHAIRAWGDLSGSPEILADDPAHDLLTSAARVDMLALSGGSDGGAYGAGFLKGWTERGDRPQFDYVTGVSTGALIAPLAFLGPGYDPLLEHFYTETRSADVLLLKPLQVLTGAPAVGDPTPLRRRIAAIVTPRMVDAIAAERLRGRLLLVGTTNLDAQRQVIWDIGRIAASGQPDRVELIRQVLLASASIPGAFPPVPIEVVADGQRYSELHVDGGVTHGIFAYPPSVRLPRRRGQQRNLWVIRNSKLAPELRATKGSAVAVVERGLDTMIKSQAHSDMDTIARQARRDGFRLRMTAVPPDFPYISSVPFDPLYMQTLFRTGYAAGRSGRAWADDIAPLMGAVVAQTAGEG
ncbi:patatin-like phospholipase family protein [Paracoccus sp. SJTW-4]|uniref:patatin-like phospholipase family protein n=1 Tax=Paracoccus sp. SJTW-4 TaxID=3078428 RepID=UPI0039ECE7D7